MRAAQGYVIELSACSASWRHEAVACAATPAADLLKARFGEVRSEIVKALADWGDPIQQAADAVVEREETRLRRSDAQRAKVLGELERLRQSIPGSPIDLAA